MPTFDEYVETLAEISITPREFVQACDEDDFEELQEHMRESRYYKPGITLVLAENIYDVEWNEVMKKLVNSRMRMDLSDIETIINIAKKY